MAIPKIRSYSLSDIHSNIDNRVDWQLDKQRAVFLIHDMQQYFVDFYDSSELIEKVVSHIAKIKSVCKAMNIPVVYTAQPNNQSVKDRALLTDFWGKGLSDEKATKIVAGLKPDSDDTVLTKWRYSAFKRSELKNIMDEWGRDQLIIVGVYAHIGCMLTAADAFMHDIQAFIISDATADFSRKEHEFALQYVAKRCGYVMSANQLISGFNQNNTLTEERIPDSLEALLIQVANILQIDKDEIYIDDNLYDLGMDSIRAMTLLGRWQKQGMDIPFIEFASRFSISEWWELMVNDKKAIVA